MKALVLVGERSIELQDLPIPTPGPDEILVRHKVTAISTRSEVIRYLMGACPNIGYLGAGVIEAVGTNVTHLQPGDHVRTAGPHHEYVLMQAENALRIPEHVDFDQAAYAYLPTLALHALRICDYQLGENASIIGQGVVGLMGSALCQALGISVIALDVDENRLDIARQMGVRNALNPSAADFSAKLEAIVGDRGIDVSVDATGNYRGLVQAMEQTRKWGRIAILGIYRPDPPDPEMAALLHKAYMRNLHSKELRLVGCSNDPQESHPPHILRFSFNDNIRLSLQLLDEGRYTLAPAITDRFQPEDGLTLYENLSKPGKLGVLYDW